MTKISFIARVVALLPFEKEAFSNSIRSAAIARWGKKPNFPQDEEGIDKLLTGIENLVPNPANSKAKKYFEFLLRLLFERPTPEFQLGEDDYQVKPLMQRFDRLCTSGALNGEAANLQTYDSREGIERACDAVEKEKAEKKKGTYTPEQEETIAKGSKVIYSDGEWAVHMIAKGSSAAGYAAAMLLCDNKMHNVIWCVGRGTKYCGMYIPNGNFYVLEHNGNSEYAISTTNHSASIWNPADTNIWTTGGTGNGSFPHLEKVAKSKGIEVNFNDLSALPTAIVPVLQAITKKDKYLADRIPAEALTEGDPLIIAKVLHLTPIKEVVEDLNTNFRGRGAGAAGAVMAAAVDPKVHIEFKDGFKDMTTETFCGYIEAYAAKVGKTLAKEAEEFLLGLIKERKTAK